MLTDLEKKIIALMQTDIPVIKRPFLEMAEKIGITEDKFLGVLKDLDKRGLIRRFGATLKHQKSGFKANAMVAWKVPEERVEKTGNIMATFHEITHCYRRNPARAGNIICIPWFTLLMKMSVMQSLKKFLRLWKKMSMNFYSAEKSLKKHQ